MVTVFLDIDGADYSNMINYAIQSDVVLTNTSYICYAIDLFNGVINFNVFNASNIKDARNVAKKYLSEQLGLNILSKNLMLNPSKNSDIGYTSTLSNSFVGNIDQMNRYYNNYKYQVGCIKFNKSLVSTKIRHSWIYECYK